MILINKITVLLTRRDYIVLINHVLATLKYDSAVEIKLSLLFTVISKHDSEQLKICTNMFERDHSCVLP